MLSIYWSDEKPDDVQEFWSMHPSLAERKGVLVQISARHRDEHVPIVIDEVCAENTIYQGAPFVGPRLETEGLNQWN
jgi:hypothetical protein